MLKGDGEALNSDWNVLMGDWRELESIWWIKDDGKALTLYSVKNSQITLCP